MQGIVKVQVILVQRRRSGAEGVCLHFEKIHAREEPKIGNRLNNQAVHL